MQIIPTALPDVLILAPHVMNDERGFFMETFREDSFLRAGISNRFVQDNHSGSHKGVLRGMHYQIRQPQGKLVRVVAGEVFDVAVDLREGSPTFGEWAGQALSSENKHMMWIPPGFAHGFYVMGDWAELAYKATDYYLPDAERVLLWNDPDIGIQWPIPEGQAPALSPKDSQGTRFLEADIYKESFLA
jgi:dTDP-4-dehydrorhamnose 3,5-epimerase